MKLFISWSTPQAKKVAEALSDFLQNLLHVLEPFVSSQDIGKGTRGGDVIARELEGASDGIICLNRENQNSQWINFEAGAISKQVDDSRLYTVLIDLPSHELVGPLKGFQYSYLFDKEEMLALVKSIWARCPSPRPTEARLVDNFEIFWPALMERLRFVRIASVKEARREESIQNKGDLKEILNEVLYVARQNRWRLDQIEAEYQGVSPWAPPPEHRNDPDPISMAQKVLDLIRRYLSGVDSRIVAATSEWVIADLASDVDPPPGLQKGLSELTEGLEFMVELRVPNERVYIF